ncbi:MAG: hypothetical protein KDA60_11205, partial [Planctomycetales bacterium]|nr:hypothetical protein [Planctomycetales bacterium]
GDGPSLIVVDTEGNYDASANWRASTSINGTPGIGGSIAVGDFNADGRLDAADVNQLYSIIRAGTNVGSFDLTGDGSVNVADLENWVTERKRTVMADFNLDYHVDGSDFNIWLSHRFSNVAGYTEGDTNADGVSDASDFNTWFAHRFTSAPSVSAAASAAPRAPLGNGPAVNPSALATIDSAFTDAETDSAAGEVTITSNATPGDQETFSARHVARRAITTGRRMSVNRENSRDLPSDSQYSLMVDSLAQEADWWKR